MNGHQAAHHLKADAPSERELRVVALAAVWRSRVASGFKARDPLSRGRRELANRRLSRKRFIAQLFLICLRARAGGSMAGSGGFLIPGVGLW